MSEVYSLLLIPMGYLLGSFPSTYLLGRILKKVDLRREGDGHIGATAVYRQIGLFPFIITIILDVLKGAAAILISNAITQNQWIVLAVGIAAMIGHCWSIFIGFKGGLGATVIHGVLAALVIWQYLICAVLAGMIFAIIRKSTLSTVLLIVFMVVALFITQLITRGNPVISLYPLVFLGIQCVKRLQVKKATPVSDYKDNLFQDLKRIK